MSSKKPQPDFAPYVLRGDAIQAVQISALWFADGAPQLPNTVKIKRALRRVAIGLGETEVSAGHGDWLILTAEGAPVLMSDRDFRMLFRPALEQAPSDQPSGPNEPEAQAREPGLNVLGLDDGTLCIDGPEYPDVIAELPFAGAAFESKQREYAWLFAAAPDLLAAAKLALESLSTNSWNNGSHRALIDAIAKCSPPDLTTSRSPDLTVPAEGGAS